MCSEWSRGMFWKLRLTRAYGWSESLYRISMKWILLSAHVSHFLNLPQVLGRRMILTWVSWWGDRLRGGEELAQGHGVEWQSWDLHSDVRIKSLALASCFYYYYYHYLLLLLLFVLFCFWWEVGVPRCFGGEGRDFRKGGLIRSQAAREGFLTEVGSEMSRFMEGGRIKKDQKQTAACAGAFLRLRM